MTQDITPLGMVFAFAPLSLSFAVLVYLGIGRKGALAVSFGRMGVQLWLVGLYLSHIFAWNHPAITLGYLLVMLGVANFTMLRNSGMGIRLFFDTLPALFLGLGLVLGYFTLLVFSPQPLYDARYLIPLAGMLLGNSMRRTIITLERFYGSIRRDWEGYLSLVMMGATVSEASKPYLRTAYKAGLEPMLANTATMGLVFLPGMMTGQILGGSSPAMAIKYQIVIMLAITAAAELSTLLSVRLSLRRAFDAWGYLRQELFR